MRMNQRKPPVPAKRLVWRITDAAPLGEYVDPQAIAAPPSVLPVAEATESSGGWVVSSFDLLHGADVTEDYDTVPADLMDAFFAAPEPEREPPQKK